MVVSPQRLTRWPSYVRDRHAAITYTTPRDAPHNPDQSLLTTKQLPNLGRVVLRGNPTDGWTLQEWNADPPPC
ncbi:hypothetical protein MAHJHV29_49480 [Mycobacterium avium subsp. hominissuis]